jgi:nitrite reductase (NO-forming)
MKLKFKVFTVILLLALFVSACGQAAQQNKVFYELKTGLQDGKMVFIGVGGEIDGVANPTLKAKVGDVLTIKLMSGEGAEHNIIFPDFDIESEHVVGQGKTTTVTFGVDKGGSFLYYCNLAGHRQAGMEGKFEVEGPAVSAPAANPTMEMGASSSPTEAAGSASAAPAGGADISRDPTDLPGPIGDRGPTDVRIDLEAQEVVGQLADGTTFTYWTFNGKVPGPFFRIRLGDTVEVHMKNSTSSTMMHSVDFHAVTGPGGGAVMTNTAPGQETMFTFKALIPGLFVYHCATPMVAEHIANGMYGMILVEPEGGLPRVDREFYVMQGEIYTMGKMGEQGAQLPDVSKLLDEKPEYFVLNGAVGALTTNHPLKANVGETVRIFYGVGGPNYVSSFHVIGEMFDRVYDQASLTSAPLTNVQTTLVPPGGATVVEFQLQVPGRYILVDHSLSRLQRGLAGYLIVDGPAAPEIYNGTPQPGSGH